MSKLNPSLIERVTKLEESGTITKAKVSDPNLQLFIDDEWRYKAYRWYCFKSVFIKGVAIIAGASPLVAGFVELVRNAMG
jgi:hypothetical protein